MPDLEPTYLYLPTRPARKFEVQRYTNFLISKGENYHYVETADIAYFYSEDGVVFRHTFQNKRHMIIYTLDQIEQQLDNRLFFVCRVIASVM